MSVEFRPELLKRFATHVGVLWDEAQDDPKLLRFLAPFGRPDLGRVAAAFRNATSFWTLFTEDHPVYATWLATLLMREGAGAPQRFEHLAPREAQLLPSVTLDADLTLAPRGTLVVAGSLTARMVLVRGGCLVVAGDVRCQLLVADGCVLIGGRLEADFVTAPASRISRPSHRSERSGREAAAVGWQVADSVKCRVFDSPRFGLACPVSAEVVTRAVGRPVTPRANEALRSLLVDKLAPGADGLDFERVAYRIARGYSVFRQ